MHKKELLDLFHCDDIRLLPETILPVVLAGGPPRDEIYKELLRMNNYDLSFDWFQDIYEKEQSDRKEKKQDFTPAAISCLVSELAGCGEGSTHEPTAGNGGMIIADWWRKASRHVPFDFYPSKNPVDAWELSPRSIPFLLLNLSIRGIVGTVHYGDVLTREEKSRYLLVNKGDDALAFSEIKTIQL